MRVGAGISDELRLAAGAAAAARAAAQPLGGADVDLALVFASGAHLADPEAMLAAVHAELAPARAGRLRRRRRARSADASSRAGPAWRCGRRPWRAARRGRFTPPCAGEDDVGVLEGMPEIGSGGAVIMLSDPYSFPTDAVLDGIADAAPGVPVLGGLSSARSPMGDAVLFSDEPRPGGGRGRRVPERRGDVAVRLAGRGAAGPRDDHHRRRGQRDLRAGRATGGAGDRAGDRRAAAGRARAGRRRAADRDRHRRRQARVRAGRLPGPRRASAPTRTTGAVTVGAVVAPGEVVRLHARDARSADEDLRRELRLRADGDRRPAAGGRAGVLLQRARAHDVRRLATTTRRWSRRSSAVSRRRASSPPARSGPWAAAASCTGSRRRWPCSPADLPAPEARFEDTRLAARDAIFSSAARRQHRAAHRRHRRDRRGDRPRARRRAGCELLLERAPRGRAAHSWPRSSARAAVAVRPRRRRGRGSARRRRRSRPRSMCWSPTRPIPPAAC